MPSLPFPGDTPDSYPHTFIDLRRYTLRTCRRLLDKYDLDDWKVVIDTRPTTRRVGQCRYQKKEVGISEYFILKETEHPHATYRIKGVILHEIAHALAPGSHHWLLWKKQFARLLWEELKGNTCLVEHALAVDHYCWRNAGTLVEFAAAKQGTPITLAYRKKANAVKRKYPESTRRLYVIQGHEVGTFWILSEGPKTYLCSTPEDRCGEGTLRRFHKERQQTFLDFEEAVIALICSLDEEICSLSDNLPDLPPRLQAKFKTMIHQRRNRKEELLDLISQGLV